MFKSSHKTPEPVIMNTEVTNKQLRDVLTNGLGDDVIRYLNATYLDKTYGTSKYTDTQIRSFISAIFNLFSKGNVCFSAGTVVFNDFGKLLFNLLTYNQLQIDDGIYLCNNPKQNSRGDNIISELVHVKTTHKTHNKVFTSNKAESIACLPTIETKFERIITPSIKGLCDETSQGQYKSESKRILLYYPFKVDDNKQLLFFKLERDEIVSRGHVKKAIATYVGNKVDAALGNSKPFFGVNEIINQGTDTITGFDMRREDRSPEKNPNECDYSNFFSQKDIEFYTNYYKILGIDKPSDEIIQNSLTELEWYNANIRTGCEFYVTGFLLLDMLKYLFVPKQSVTLTHMGGNNRFKTIIKRSKSKSRKAKRSKSKSRKAKRSRSKKAKRSKSKSRKTKTK